jgi:DNA topoisomerase-1
MNIKRSGNYKIGFKYYKNNQEITDIQEIEKIRALKIPPAYENVTILNNKKVVAFGYDSKGRKQVIYHPDFVRQRNAKKYKKIIEFAHLFTKIKNKIMRDIKSQDQYTKEIAMVIYLIFHCGFRIGNEKYEKTNQSYGLTTMKFSHLAFDKKECIAFDFVGKKGVRNQSSCNHKYICAYLKEKKASSHETSNVFSVKSHDVNEYLRSIDKDIQLTSKDLRTWNANHLFIKFFHDKKIQEQKNPVKRAIEMVANELHNTPAICKKSYIDPRIIDHANEVIENQRKK